MDPSCNLLPSYLYAMPASQEKKMLKPCVLMLSLSQMLIYSCLCNVTGYIPIQKIACTLIHYKHYQMLLSIISSMRKTQFFKKI